MKTKITFIAIAVFSLTCSGILAQNATEEGAPSNKVYVTKKAQNSKVFKKNKEQAFVASKSSAAAELINYQAVARNAGGDLMVNTAVTIEFTIRNGAGGTTVYNETQNLNTDTNGVFFAQIGAVASIAGINWIAIDPWLQVNLNGTNVGETQMASVPGALYSKSSGSVTIYGSGFLNADKMIAMHSPTYSSWGIGYSDSDDQVDFIGSGVKNLRIKLSTGDLRTNGTLEVLKNTGLPAPNKVYGNSMPIAFGTVDGSLITSNYGITSVVSPATGVYLVTLDISAASKDDIVPLITPYTLAGTGEMTGFEPVSNNSFEVKLFDKDGVAKNSAFSMVVFANR